ncbi:ProQ/FinO family protein [Escherichia coli]|nr:ProQ/FinO family protein [Escherichia coli]EHP9644730.1 ProQ/FinO family protein [Escherichia coli]EHP9683113.1 ProQ/FinO family protein [Escherichia coli]EHP9688366.1 ProQ/FinO family protein [Escherichia coli]EHP9718019.1 ProQ/FinO family protein [Escherichia coli]
MTKRQRKNRRRINLIAEYWPELFNTDPVKPVKPGVIHDMLQDAKARELVTGHGVLRGALTSYIHSTRYLKAIIAGGPRYGLNGQPCGEVTEEDKSVASELLKRRLERMKQQNSQQQSAGGEASDKGQCGTET